MNAHLHQVTKIWDQAPHNAFTDLTRFQGKWLCTFREAGDHMTPDGKLRVITSADGHSWTSAALLESPDSNFPDLRDSKIGVTADQRLMLMGVATFTGQSEDEERRTYVWFCDDGLAWSEPIEIGKDGIWLWSFTWANEIFYAAGYKEEDGVTGVYLYQGIDALHLKRLTTLHSDSQYPNETALLIEGNDGLAIIRREFAPGQTESPPYNNGTALLATSQAPFEKWTPRDLGVYVGGPALLRLPNKSIIVAGRKVVSEQHSMALWELDAENAALRELSTLPSGDDCSYPGLVWHEDRLWVSYYSSHEGKAKIYLAEVEIT